MRVRVGTIRRGNCDVIFLLLRMYVYTYAVKCVFQCLQTDSFQYISITTTSVSESYMIDVGKAAYSDACWLSLQLNLEANHS